MAFVKRKWLAFWQRVALTLAEERFRGSHLRGCGWYGFAVEASPTLAEYIRDALDWIHREVKRLIYADLDMASAVTKWDVLAIHCPPTVEVDELVRVITQHNVFPMGSVQGRYIPEYGSVVLSGAPESLEFCACSAHEMCHALCHCLLGASGRIPWSYEGYAELVSDRVVRRRLGVSNSHKHLSVFKHLCLMARDLPLRQVLMIEDYEGGMPPHYTNAFISHVALFVAFLNEAAALSARVRGVFNAAVRQDVSSCRALVETLEQASGKTLEEIDEDFHEFCSNL